MMQLETCSQNSQRLTDNLKLISIHSKQSEVRQSSTQGNSQLVKYQLTDIKWSTRNWQISTDNKQMTTDNLQLATDKL